MGTVAEAISVLADLHQILVFTGAGISTESGIPDFRGPNGVWTKVDPADFTIDRYMASTDVRARSWARRLGSGARAATPNAGHRALVDLWLSGRMVGCVTQNIDGLHSDAGLPPQAVIEVHGNTSHTRCTVCRTETPTVQVLDRVRNGEADPRCEACGGILKVGVVFFGESMPATAMTRAYEWAATADAVLAIGSTLSVYPAASIPLEVAKADKPLIIINQGETDLDPLATVRVDEPAGTALKALVKALVA